MVFLLHRIMTDSSADDRTLSLRAASEGRKALRDVQMLFMKIMPELEGDRFWRYQHNISPGLQEYIEALSFAHYLQHGTLIPYGEVQKSLSDESGSPVRSIPSTTLPSIDRASLAVFPSSHVGLHSRPVRSDWRAYAFRHFFYLEARRPHQGI